MTNPVDNSRIGAPVALAVDEMMAPLPGAKKGWKIGEVSLFEPLDLGIWIGVLLFFGISALVGGGDLKLSFVGALGVIFIMFFVGISVELIIESLKDVKGLGTLVGFITNGPEGLCPDRGPDLRQHPFRGLHTPGLQLHEPLDAGHLGPDHGQFSADHQDPPGLHRGLHPHHRLLCRELLFHSLQVLSLVGHIDPGGFGHPVKMRPDEPAEEEEDEAVSRAWFIPAFVVLITAGYLLDPVVTYSAEHSHALRG